MKMDKATLGKEETEKQKASTSAFSKTNLKYLSLVILTFQNASLVLVSRYSRIMKGPKYLVSTAVVIIELTKFLICIVLVLFENSGNVVQTAAVLREEIIVKYWETAKVSVPSLLYAIQNNLFFIALSYLDAATFQITYQMKLFTTAFFSIVILGKRISVLQWTALFILATAIVLVQLPSSGHAEAKDHSSSERLFGLLAVSLACVSSGFSGVYFEMMLKGSSTSIWIRNIQLGFLGFIFALMGVFGKDREAVMNNGFFQGYNYVVVSAILLQAAGGLVVAAVIKYADNILKGFATAVSIVLSSIFSYLLLADFTPSFLFAFGAVLVIVSIFMYGLYPAAPAPQKETSTSTTKTSQDEILLKLEKGEEK